MAIRKPKMKVYVQVLANLIREQSKRYLYRKEVGYGAMSRGEIQDAVDRAFLTGLEELAKHSMSPDSWFCIHMNGPIMNRLDAGQVQMLTERFGKLDITLEDSGPGWILYPKEAKPHVYMGLAGD